MVVLHTPPITPMHACIYAYDACIWHAWICCMHARGGCSHPSDKPHGSSSNLTLSSHLADNHHHDLYLADNPHDTVRCYWSKYWFCTHEAFIKLTHDSSRVELEDHLKNASRLISTDKRIPISLSEIIAMMKKLPPRHFFFSMYLVQDCRGYTIVHTLILCACTQK